VQSRAVVRLPARITLKGKITSKKKRTASFTGLVTENSAGVAAARVQLLLGTTVGFTATTKANGSYALSLKKKGKKGTTDLPGSGDRPGAVDHGAGLPAVGSGCGGPPRDGQLGAVHERVCDGGRHRPPW